MKNEEMFGSLPLHVRGHDHIYDGLDDAMVNNQIRANDQESNSTQEVGASFVVVVVDHS